MESTKTILVTGGAGFIGSHLCEFLLQNGHQVICYDNFNDFYNPIVKEKNINTIIHNPQFSLIKADIRNKEELNQVFQKYCPELVVHLAGMPGVRQSIEDPFLYFDVNVTGTLTLLETMKKFEVKDMIFASSSSVYGNNLRVPFSEKDQVDKQISPYASSKKSGESLCYTYNNLYKFNITCLRFFTVYGPRQRPDLAIHKFTDKILKGKPIQVYGEGHTARDYTYISDITAGIYKSINFLNGYNIYNIGESVTISLNKMIETIEKTLGIKAIKEYFPGQPGDVGLTFADISKARNELAFDPKVSFDEGIEYFVKWKLSQI